MTSALDPRVVYPEANFFLDYIAGGGASAFFEYSFNSLHRAAEARNASLGPAVRSAVCDALLSYNRQLDASGDTLRSIEHLRDPGAFCVVGGQQAGFLGGPAFVLYKIASIIRAAARLSERLGVPVAPVFWLATEDHDFSEINHIRWLDDADGLQTISFDWDDRGHPIEHLPITKQVRAAFDTAMQQLPFASAFDPAILSPSADETYARWHARLWSRLFAPWGLILVEPRILRPLAQPFFARARADENEIQRDLAHTAAELSLHGYSATLDPQRSGTLFVIQDNGARRRIEASDSLEEATVSTDAALRPLLADSLLPTLGNVLGPSELEYQAMLRPLYHRFDIPQPLAIPRFGATILSRKDAQLIDDISIEVTDVLDPAFDAAEAARRSASSQLRSEFAQAGARMEEVLTPLRTFLEEIDPGLAARWRQALDQSKHQLDRLESRAVRAELARRGISAKRLSGLKSRLLPTGRPQERVIAAVSMLARHGVEWVHDLIADGEPDRFEHQLIVLGEEDD